MRKRCCFQSRSVRYSIYGLYSFYAFHSTGNTESSSTYRRPTWEPRLLARLRTRPRHDIAYCGQLVMFLGNNSIHQAFPRARLAHGQPATDAITSLAMHVIGGIGLRESSRPHSEVGAANDHDRHLHDLHFLCSAGLIFASSQKE